MTIHGTLFTAHAENQATDPFVLQNKKLLKVSMAYGPVMARLGSMVAYQGDVHFERRGSGMAKAVMSHLTGEGLQLMTCTGQGEMFLALEACEIQVIYLENDMISVNGSNVLAFSASIEWDIHRIGSAGAAMAGGLYNVALRGSGYVALTTKGDPVALDVASAPTFADPQALVAWTGGVMVDVKMDTGGLGSLIRGGTGEMWQAALRGQGYALIQPSESVVVGGTQATSPPPGGGLLGGLMGR